MALIDDLNQAVARIEGAVNNIVDALNAGTIAAAVTLGYFDFRHPDLGWRAERPKLARWYETQASRPAMLATAPPEASPSKQSPW